MPEGLSYALYDTLFPKANFYCKLFLYQAQALRVLAWRLPPCMRTFLYILYTVYTGAESFIHLQVVALGTWWSPEEASTPHMFGERVTASPWYLWILIDTAGGLANPLGIYFPTLAAS